jgi:hypothetical protein
MAQCGRSASSSAGDAQRQWQVAALPGHHRRGLGLRLDPASPSDTAEQLQRRLGKENLDFDVDSAAQPAQPLPTGNDYRRRASAGEQRRYLALTCRVVEHYQHLAVGEQVPVHFRALVQALRDLRARHAQRPQEPVEDLHRADRMPGARVQVREELPVRELPGHAVGHVDSQAGLAHAPCPVITTTGAAALPSPEPVRCLPICPSCAARPVKSATSAGSSRGMVGTGR